MSGRPFSNIFSRTAPRIAFPIAAAVAALVGIFDSLYLTVNHGQSVPCSLVEGCEKVLTSEYAEVFGIPTAAFGLAAYCVALPLAVYGAYGSRAAWNLFGVLALLMFGFSGWLIYLQAFVIGAFCQFCLLSAATSTILGLLFICSKFFVPSESK